MRVDLFWAPGHPLLMGCLDLRLPGPSSPARSAPDMTALTNSFQGSSTGAIFTWLYRCSPTHPNLILCGERTQYKDLSTWHSRTFNGGGGLF